MQGTNEICYNKNTLSRKLNTANVRAAYDENVKLLLSEKIILAYILMYAVPEYKGMQLEEVIPLIEDTPQVATVPVEPGETNSSLPAKSGLTSGSEITGGKTEDIVPGEGYITYDIRFCAWAPNHGELLKLIVDVEAQKNYYPGYDIVTRGIFCTARLLSAQKNTEFSGSDYDNLKKVYSIWICLNVPKYAENTITEYTMAQRNVVGNFPQGKSRYDLLSVIVICLPHKPQAEDMQKGLLQLLGVLLSDKISVPIKKNILENDYQIPMKQELDRRVNAMCNLSEAIEERGIKRGIEQGIEQGIQRGCEVVIQTCEELKVSWEDTFRRVVEKFSLSDEVAEEYMSKYWLG